jgi:DUSP domain
VHASVAKEVVETLAPAKALLSNIQMLVPTCFQYNTVHLVPVTVVKGSSFFRCEMKRMFGFIKKKNFSRTGANSPLVSLITGSSISINLMNMTDIDAKSPMDIDDQQSAEPVQQPSPPPPAAEQLALIKPEDLNRPIKIGDKWFIISAVWFKRWKMEVGFAADAVAAAEAATQEEQQQNSSQLLNPIDNAFLCISSDTPILRKGIVEHVDFELVPEDVANLLFKW